MLLNRLPKENREQIEKIDNIDTAINESIEVFGDLTKGLKKCVNCEYYDRWYAEEEK